MARNLSRPWEVFNELPTPLPKPSETLKILRKMTESGRLDADLPADNADACWYEKSRV